MHFTMVSNVSDNSVGNTPWYTEFELLLYCRLKRSTKYYFKHWQCIFIKRHFTLESKFCSNTGKESIIIYNKESLCLYVGLKLMTLESAVDMQLLLKTRSCLTCCQVATDIGIPTLLCVFFVKACQLQQLTYRQPAQNGVLTDQLCRAIYCIHLSIMPMQIAITIT